MEIDVYALAKRLEKVPHDEWRVNRKHYAGGMKTSKYVTNFPGGFVVIEPSDGFHVEVYRLKNELDNDDHGRVGNSFIKWDMSDQGMYNAYRAIIDHIEDGLKKKAQGLERRCQEGFDEWLIEES